MSTGEAGPDPGPGRSRRTVHSERLVDETRHVRLGVADVTLPDGGRFTQYVMRLPRAALAVVLNGRDEVLMMWRHRFVLDRWAWELPGGYVDAPDVDPAATAAREVEEETGWRPYGLELLVAFQPLVGSVEQENLIFLTRGADYVGAPVDVNEAERVAWVPLGSVLGLIARGEIMGAGSVVGLLRVLVDRATARPPAV